MNVYPLRNRTMAMGHRAVRYDCTAEGTASFAFQPPLNASGTEGVTVREPNRFSRLVSVETDGAVLLKWVEV